MTKPPAPRACGAELTALAVELTRAASRFTRLAGRVPGMAYSAVVWRVLSDLESADARIGDLAQRERVAQPTMTSLLHRLEGEGWLTRRPDPSDGRATLIAITSRGRAALTDFRSAAAERVRPGLEQLPDADLATLARAAELLRDLAE